MLQHAPATNLIELDHYIKLVWKKKKLWKTDFNKMHQNKLKVKLQITLLKFRDVWILHLEVLEFGFYSLKFRDTWILHQKISEFGVFEFYTLNCNPYTLTPKSQITNHYIVTPSLTPKSLALNPNP